MQNVLDYCLKADPSSPTVACIAQWRELWGSKNSEPIVPGQSVAAAVRAGFHADSVAWAFLSGYQAAIRCLLLGSGTDITMPINAIVGFSVSEKNGNAPRDVNTTINIHADGSLVVSGEKTWVIAGEDCDWLIVSGVNQEPAFDEANRLDIRLVAVAVNDPGVLIVPNPPTQFIPEVVHSSVQLKKVQLPQGRLLSGDGHQRYVKPFRTLEDIHIAAATLAFLLRCARLHQWSPAFIELALSHILALNALSLLDPAAPQTHIALAGVLNQVHQFYESATACWHETVGAEAMVQKWDRDIALFGIAIKTRQLRADRAWATLQRQG